MTVRYRGFGRSLIDLEGAVDMHVHTHPDIFPRLVDDVEAARAARDAGMAAIVFKSHHENTVTRAFYANGLVPEVRSFGGIVLNSYVGFMNAAAVEVALRLGGRFVWMPTVDAAYHAEVHGGSGNLVGLSGGLEGGAVYTVLDHSGALKGEVSEVLALIAEHDAVLATAHLSPREVLALVEAARTAGIERIVITHPFYKAPGLSLDQLEQLVAFGAVAEMGYCDYSAMWHVGIVEEVVEAVERLGADNCVLVSDAGQTHNPPPPESLRVFAQTLVEKGVAEADVVKMIKDVPRQVLDLDAPVPRPHWTEPPSEAALDEGT